MLNTVYTGYYVLIQLHYVECIYIDDIFDETISKIKLQLSGKNVWVSID